MKKEITNIKRIIAKYGNLMATEVNSESSINYGSLGNNITALIEEYKINKVSIVVYDCRTGEEIDDFYLPYEELTKETIFEINEYLENYDISEEKTMDRCKSYNF